MWIAKAKDNLTLIIHTHTVRIFVWSTLFFYLCLILSSNHVSLTNTILNDFRHTKNPTSCVFWVLSKEESESKKASQVKLKYNKTHGLCMLCLSD